MTKFLRERHVRMFLQSLYTALIESVENSEIFEEGLDDKTTPTLFHGNWLVKNCAFRSSMWLRVIRDFTVSEEVYRHHFRGPVRLLARLRLNARHTESLEVFVFSKSSDFYDRYFGCQVQSLSVIVPELGSAMSIRLRSSDAADIKPGSLYTISYVQPMPYVNRIHPVRNTISEEGGQFLLSHLDSLKISIDDLELFQSSLAFENFSEVECHQVGKRLLGAPVIISGYLEDIDIPFIHLKGCSGKRAMCYINNKHFRENSGITEGELRSLAKKPVSVLAVVWYGKRRDKKLYPEVFMLERLEGDDDPIQAEACGYIRLRAPLHAGELAAKFPHIELPACSSIYRRGEIVDWKPEAFSNKIIYREFYSALRQTRRRLRLGEPVKEMLACSELLLDKNRMKIEWLADRINSEAGLLKSLLSLLMYQDKTGELPRRMTELCGIVSGDSRGIDPRQHIRWLMYTGVLVRRERVPVIGRKGINVALAAIKPGLVKRAIDAIRQGKGIVLDELARKLDLPPSLLLLGLKRLERERYVRCLDECGLYWVSAELVDSGEVMSEAERVLAEYEQAVLAALREVYHSLHSSKVAEILQKRGYHISHYTVLKLLERLENMKIIVQRPGGMWIYPLTQRIKDFLKSHPISAFDCNQIAEHIRAPLDLKHEIPKVLEELHKESVIWQPLDGLWAINPENESGRQLQIKYALLERAKAHILQLLKRVQRAQDQWLIEKTRMELRPIAAKAGYRADISDIVDTAISELIKQGLVKTYVQGVYKWLFPGKYEAQR